LILRGIFFWSSRTGGAVETYFGDLELPVDLAFNADGELFVCELRAGRVTAFKSPRKRRVVASGLGNPHGLAFGSSGVTCINPTRKVEGLNALCNPLESLRLKIFQ
jgi:glucose/arabinose dehydrogenase